MLVLLAALIAVTPAKPVGPTFVENDYAKALKQAKSSKKLLFVDAWATWCHSCVYMREHVMNQPELKPFEKDLVFASIDTELAKSAPFLEKYPIRVYPTLLFIDPATETIRFRWEGSADIGQLTALLSAAQQRDARMIDADATFAKGDAAGAAEKFLAARKIAAEGTDDGRATMSLIAALAAANQNDLCAKIASDEGSRLKARSDQMFAAVTGLSCATEMAKGPARDAQVGLLITQLKAQIASPDALMADDVSSGYELLVDEREQAQDEAGKVELAKAWQTFLDGAAANAKTPAARASFDAHRVGAAIASKQPDHMIAPLLLSEKEFPADYNPAARLALLYREQGKLPEAQAAIERALPKCQGPRKMRLYSIQASIFEKRGDTAGQKKSVQAAIAYAKTLPIVQRPTKQLASLEATLKGLP